MKNSVPDHERLDIPAGMAIVGTRNALIRANSEGPPRRQKLAAYGVDGTSVSNRHFAEFVDDTGYATEAERIGWSYVFFDHLPEAIRVEQTRGVASAGWWRQVHGANWRAVNGPGSEGAARPDHPVVHVSQRDALAFARRAGGRLPNRSRNRARLRLAFRTRHHRDRKGQLLHRRPAGLARRRRGDRLAEHVRHPRWRESCAQVTGTGSIP